MKLTEKTFNEALSIILKEQIIQKLTFAEHLLTLRPSKMKKSLFLNPKRFEEI